MPSANISSGLSPVNAIDVLDEFKNKLKLVIDGGRSKIGIESTVIDLTSKPKILRPGIISSNEIKKSIVGNGHATKTQMQYMVKELLSLNTEVCRDASDALASAITLSHRLKLNQHDQQNPRNNC